VDLAKARKDILEYLPEDPRERGFRQRMLELLEARAPTSRSHFTPGHLTASGFVLSPERDAVLLIFHKKLGIWVQPGGHIEDGDDSLPARKDEPAHEHFDVRYCFHSPTRDFVPSDEVAGARWAELARIDQLTSDESVLRAVRKLARPSSPY